MMFDNVLLISCALMAAFALGILLGAMLRAGKDSDSEEVVYCRECKYREDHFMGGLYCNHPDNRNPLGCRPNDYCNDGVRGEEEPQ